MTLPEESFVPYSRTKPKPHISSGVPFPQAVAHHLIQDLKSHKPYLIVSKSISKTQNFVNLKKALNDAEHGLQLAGIRFGISSHTPWDEVLEVVRDARECGADALVTLGAGSLTDGGKVVQLALANNVSTHDELAQVSADEVERTGRKINPCQVPMINIPTSLSGGEYSSLAGATDSQTREKVMFLHGDMGAEIVVLDPELCESTPERVWLSSGIRGVDHCVEGWGYLGREGREDGVEEFRKGLRLLVPSLLVTKGEKEDKNARMESMWGVVEAMKGLGNGVQMGASHGMGHQLGPFGVGHGETSCIFLPEVLKFNARHASSTPNPSRILSLQKSILSLLWAEAPVKSVLEKRGLSQETADLGDVIGAIIDELGLPRTLKDVGVGRDKFEALTVNCLKDRWLATNPVPVTTKEQVGEILEMCAGDGE
ncbi:hypothetical protein CJF32_00007469 [Rutstroemia sp. NJR-2017a WRK4]|nr:hypothetical protein CJF32_00007469 [Rutstroemia sp. NJR-2017a WRK4]